MRAPPLVRAQLGESLKAVAGRDFPEHWPGLLPAILQNLSSQVRPWAYALSPSIQNPILAFSSSRHAFLVSVSLPSWGGLLQKAMSADFHLALLGALSQQPHQQVMMVQDHGRLYGALYALRILARKYEFKDEEDRAPLTGIVNSTFPALLQLFQVPAATELSLPHSLQSALIYRSPSPVCWMMLTPAVSQDGSL